MKRKLVIVKLGGSIITDKNKSRGVFRRKVVARLAEEIAEAKKKKKFDLIIACGAGSFGHPIARRYNLHRGYLGPRSLKGFVLCKKALFELNLLVWCRFVEVGLLACVVQPSAVITTSGGKINKFDTQFIEKLIEEKVIPILSADVVFDKQMGFVSLSADRIVSFLAKKFKASRVIFASDVDGVFDKNPKINKNAKLIREINSRNYAQVIQNMKVHNRDDISGEMKGKILAIKEELAGIEVLLVNGFQKGGILKALENYPIGTSFHF